MWSFIVLANSKRAERVALIFVSIKFRAQRPLSKIRSVILLACKSAKARDIWLNFHQCNFNWDSTSPKWFLLRRLQMINYLIQNQNKRLTNFRKNIFYADWSDHILLMKDINGDIAVNLWLVSCMWHVICKNLQRACWLVLMILISLQDLPYKKGELVLERAD